MISDRFVRFRIVICVRLCTGKQIVCAEACAADEYWNDICIRERSGAAAETIFYTHILLH